MRVILTKVGEEVCSLLKKEIEATPIRNRSKRHSKSQVEIRTRKSENLKEPSVLNQSPSYTKSIKVRQKKIFIPKQIIDRYNSKGEIAKNNRQTQKENNDSIFNFKNSINGRADSLKQSFSLKEILPPGSENHLKENYKQKRREKEKFARVNENNFRSLSDKNTFDFKLQEVLKAEIPSVNGNLINYLKNKQDTPYFLLEKISNVKSQEVNKLNRACQKLFGNKEERNLLAHSIEKKIEEENRREAADYKTQLSGLQEDVKGIKRILDANKFNYNTKDRYYNLHKDIEKKWTNLNLQRFYHSKERTLSLNCKVRKVENH